MADRDWRALERRWLADPGDGDLLLAALAARRRAGVALPGAMLDRLVLPGRRFDADVPGAVLVTGPEGRPVFLGRTPAGGEGLAVPPHRALGIQPDPPTDRGLLAWVGRLAAEPEVGLSLRQDVTDAGVAALAALSGLPWLDLGGCRSVTRLDGLERLARLRRLSLWGCDRLTGDGLAGLAGLRGLSVLDLGRCPGVDDVVVGRLAALPELWVLSLADCGAVSDRGLADLARASRLAALDLRRCPKITDAGLARLAGLQELSLLNVSFCPALTERGLATLAELPRLSRVLVVGSGRASERARSVLRCEVVT